MNLIVRSLTGCAHRASPHALLYWPMESDHSKPTLLKDTAVPFRSLTFSTISLVPVDLNFPKKTLKLSKLITIKPIRSATQKGIDVLRWGGWVSEVGGGLSLTNHRGGGGHFHFVLGRLTGAVCLPPVWLVYAYTPARTLHPSTYSHRCNPTRTDP